MQGGGHAATMDAGMHAPGLEHLPVDVVADIARRLDQWQVLAALPRVCTAWRRLLCTPSALWRCLLLDLRFFDDLRAFLARGPAAWAPLLRQLAARAPHLRDLALLVPPERQPQFVLAALAALGPAPRLQRFCAELYACPARELPAVLAALPERLEVLSLHGLAARGDSRQLGALQRLRQLRVFHLHFLQPSGPRTEIGGSDLIEDWEDDSSESDSLTGGFPHALLSCTRLEELSIAGAGRGAFGALPAGLSQLQRLTRLTLLGCDVTSLPPGLTALTALQALHVTEVQSTQRPTTLPPSLAGMARLQAVELECATVPAQLASLPGLKHLAVWSHAWDEIRVNGTEVPGLAAVLQEVALDSLGLHCWRLRGLPPCVQQHASLRRLSLRGNLLARLPPGAYLQQLEHLDITRNRLTSVPDVALGASELRTLAVLDGQPALVLRAAGGGPLQAEAQQRLAAQLSATEQGLHRISTRKEWELMRFPRNFCEYAHMGQRGGRQQADAFLPDLFLPALHALPPTGPVRRWAERRLARGQ